MNLKKVSFTLHSFKTPAVISRLMGCNTVGNTVSELPKFNLALTTNWFQIVMDLQFWHQHLDHLEEEYQAVCLPSVLERWKMQI